MRRLRMRATEGRVSRARHQHGVERVKTRLVRGDTVQVMRGDDKGRQGKVLRVFHKTGRLTIEGVNIVKKHRKARRAEETSGIIDMPAPIALSNVMLLDPKSGKPTRIRMKLDDDGTKERISVKSRERMDAIAQPAR